MKYTINKKFINKLRGAVVASELPVLIFYDKKGTPDEIELIYIIEEFCRSVKINNEKLNELCILYAKSTKNENFEDFVIKNTLFSNESVIM